jgi:hypothetical protein
MAEKATEKRGQELRFFWGRAGTRTCALRSSERKSRAAPHAVRAGVRWMPCAAAQRSRCSFRFVRRGGACVRKRLFSPQQRPGRASCAFQVHRMNTCLCHGDQRRERRASSAVGQSTPGLAARRWHARVHPCVVRACLATFCVHLRWPWCLLRVRVRAAAAAARLWQRTFPSWRFAPVLNHNKEIRSVVS